MQRATSIELVDRFITIIGDPILDTDEGVLIIQFDDGTYRTFNWAHVVSFYHLSAEETARRRTEVDRSDD